MQAMQKQEGLAQPNMQALLLLPVQLPWPAGLLPPWPVPLLPTTPCAAAPLACSPPVCPLSPWPTHLPPQSVELLPSPGPPACPPPTCPLPPWPVHLLPPPPGPRAWAPASWSSLRFPKTALLSHALGRTHCVIC